MALAARGSAATSNHHMDAMGGNARVYGMAWRQRWRRAWRSADATRMT